MFKLGNLFKKNKKKIEISWAKIKAFNAVLVALKNFIDLKEWQKAQLWITEIKRKEKRAFDKRVYWLSWRKKDSEIKKYNKKLAKLNDLQKKLEKEKEKYEKMLLTKKHKIIEQKIKNEVNEMIIKKEYVNAAHLLNEYLKKYSTPKVIRYYNKEKARLNKLIEKENAKRKKNIQNDTMKQAQELAWNIFLSDKEKKNIDKKLPLWKRVKKKMQFYNNLKEKINRRQLLDEVWLLIEAENQDEVTIKEKLSNMHKWLAKEIKWVEMTGYDFYWKIMWADKISWDTFWIDEQKKSYKFYLWDATGHWIRAWFMVSILTQKFNEIASKFSLKEAAFKINNSLKQDLKSWNFITSVLFEINKKDNTKIDFVWMWHEPMFVYRDKKNELEKVIPWWIAAWIAVLKDISKIETKEIVLNNNDTLLVYSDWIVEAKNAEGEQYWFERLQKSFFTHIKTFKDLKAVYKNIIQDAVNFVWWSSFWDDATIILLRRNNDKDILHNYNEIKTIAEEMWVTESEAKKLKWNSIEKAKEKLELLKQDKETKRVIEALKTLYMTWEILKLKQEAIRYIKEWFIHKKINFYLKKALDNEYKYKLAQKEEKMQNKYNLLKWLYEKWDYETVATESANIISKDWNI